MKVSMPGQWRISHSTIQNLTGIVLEEKPSWVKKYEEERQWIGHLVLLTMLAIN